MDEIILSQSKFLLPALRDDFLRRPALERATLAAVRHHRLTLLSAPAGAGKTTLAAAVALAHQRQSDGAAQSVAWLRLAEADNDPATFLMALLLAVQQPLPHVGHAALDFASGVADLGRALPHALTLLLNELHARRDPLLLSLDDYHLINNPLIHQALNHLLAEMPATLRLLITTRYDPPLALPRLRMRGQLAEVRLNHLQFSKDETAQYVMRQSRYPLTASQLDALQDRTHGWITGVRLLALTLDKVSEVAAREDFLRRFSESDRLVFDLLADEVLAQQPPDLHDFLLQSSILDELTPALCRAVTARDDAPQLLRDAFQRNLFLTATTPYHGAESAYRYHDLFAALLQRKLREQSEAAFRAAHRRAAAAHDDSGQRIDHWLAAGAWSEAADEIIQLSIPDLERRLVKGRTAAWIARLPAPIMAEQPWLRLTHYVSAALQGDNSQAMLDKLAMVREEFRALGDLRGEHRALQLLCQVTDKGRAWAVDEVVTFMAAHPELVSERDRLSLLYNRLWSAFHQGDWQSANPLIGELLGYLMRNPRLHNTVGVAFGPQFYFSEAGIAPIQTLLNQIERLRGTGEPLSHFGLHLMRACLSLLQAEPEVAVAEGRQARRIFDQMGGLAWRMGDLDSIEFAVLLIDGAYERLLRLLDERLRQAQADPSMIPYLMGYHLTRVKCLFHQQDVDGMRTVLAALPSPDDAAPLLAQRDLHEGAAWLALAEQRFDAANEAWQAALAVHRRLRYLHMGGHPLLGLAISHWRAAAQRESERDRQAACRALDRLLDEAAERQMAGLLLRHGRSVIPLLRHAWPGHPHADLIAKALAAFGDRPTPQPIALPHSPDRLTPREVEVLHLLMGGASNRQIADELVVTERTAKAHVSNILRKLGVASRTEAVARAHELSLL
ncbi:MAG: NACHT domain-containing protein [Anaerolineales bacterium]|nr:NACHT domain-containing protein [Anaerolineales bacterium]MCB9126717.1 NACHT domain-containing protein [Ardenticatenales bacterium]MCB9171741.1 NACHT domain-containing protein [Ardenticatenales bacterium]